MFSIISMSNFFFCSTLSEFENFLPCERILINVKTKRQANFKDFKRFGAFKLCVNWAFFGTRGPLKRSIHSRLIMIHL
jgi:hypothetical protein